MLKSDITKIFTNFNSHTDDYLGAMYINIYNELPQCYRVYYLDDKELHYQHSSESFYDIRKNQKYKVDCRKLLQNLKDKQDELGVEVFCYSPHEFLVLGNKYSYKDSDKHSNFLMNITMSEDSDMADFYEEIFCKEQDIEKIFNLLKDSFVVSSKKNKIEFGITAIDSANTLYTSWYQYEEKNIDIEKNYNDDFPYEKICKLMETEDKAELIFFYGEPGTGKTSLIKHLISKYKESSFVFMDGTILANTPQHKLMSYFLDNQNTIFILEDCEKALKDRNDVYSGYNNVMPILLNITDGVIADVLGIKLICTFNTSLDKIDKALLRKGRLSLKYEFKKLTKDKVANILGNSVDKDMSLAEIYNIEEENDFSKKIQKKIGFN
jgi:hypothetical protein